MQFPAKGISPSLLQPATSVTAPESLTLQVPALSSSAFEISNTASTGNCIPIVPIDSLEISGSLDLDDAYSASSAASQVPVVSDSIVLVPTDHESSDSMILSSAPSDPATSDLQNSALRKLLSTRLCLLTQ